MDIQKVAYALPDKLLKPLLSISNINEIRLRINRPMVVLIKNKKCFVTNNGAVSEMKGDSIIIDETDLSEVFARLCEYSLYSKEEMINSGYIVMRNGCRAGVCGAFCEKNFNLSDINSINIRIANQVVDADLPVYYLMNKKIKSVLISGPPCSGKTTVLRELCKRFSNQMNNVCVLDEKGEIAGYMYDSLGFDLGVCTDVISYRDKADAAKMALKFMNPDIIAFDELADDIKIIRNCFKSGVKIFTTIHSDSIKDTFRRLDKLSIDAESFDLIIHLDKNTLSVADSYIIRND